MNFSRLATSVAAPTYVCLLTLAPLSADAVEGEGAGVIVGTVQQLGKDSGPTADQLDGFIGRDWTAGPILTYDTRLGGKAPLSFSLRWVPTIYSKNRLDSSSTVMGTFTMAF
jgi:hypothetical protein